MANITIEIKAEGLEQAILNLAGILAGRGIVAEANTVEGYKEVPGAAPFPSTTVVEHAAPPQIQQPIQQPLPAQEMQYSQQQLAVAATQLVDAGRREELMALLAKYNAQALTMIDKAHYGNFANDLRAMGARI